MIVDAALHKKLQIRSDSTLWPWPADARDAATLGEVAPGEVGKADVAAIFVRGRADVDTVMKQHRDALAATRAVWFIYAKGNKADLNRDTLWAQLGGYSWTAVANVSYSDTLSAVRARPLKEGEKVRDV